MSRQPTTADCYWPGTGQWYPARRQLQTDGPPLRADWPACYQQPPPPPVPQWRGYTGGIGHFAELPEPVNRRYWCHGLEPPEKTGLRYQEIRAYSGAVRAPPGVPFSDSQLAALWGPQMMTHPGVVSHHPESVSRLPSAFQYP